MPGVVLGNRLALFASLGGALLGAALFSADCRAGFLEDLFGPEDYVHPPAGPRISPSRTGARRARSHVSFFAAHRRERPSRAQIAYIPRDPDRRGDAADAGAATGARPVKPAFCARGGEALKNAPKFRQLLQDKTLRFGDIVVTETGIRVFEGHMTCPHTARDFVTLGAADLSKRQFGALSKLEDAIKAVHARYAHR